VFKFYFIWACILQVDATILLLVENYFWSHRSCDTRLPHVFQHCFFTRLRCSHNGGWFYWWNLSSNQLWYDFFSQKKTVYKILCSSKIILFGLVFFRLILLFSWLWRLFLALLLLCQEIPTTSYPLHLHCATCLVYLWFAVVHTNFTVKTTSCLDSFVFVFHKEEKLSYPTLLNFLYFACWSYYQHLIEKFHGKYFWGNVVGCVRQGGECEAQRQNKKKNKRKQLLAGFWYITAIHSFC